MSARWQRPKTFDRNLVVIGAGAAGLVTACIAAAVKAKVTLVEVHKMGGDCLNFGCAPSKALKRRYPAPDDTPHRHRRRCPPLRATAARAGRPGLRHQRHDAFAQLDAPPARLVVLGGGPIRCELAQSIARLGSQVTQVEMAPRIMIREDQEVSDIARDSLQRDGVAALTALKALRCEREGERKFTVVEHQGQEKRIEFDALLCAVGRVARLQGDGLEELGIPTQRTVVVNEYLETL